MFSITDNERLRDAYALLMFMQSDIPASVEKRAAVKNLAATVKMEILNGEGLAHAVDQHTILHGEQEVGIRGDVAVLAGGFQHGHLFAHTLDGTDNQLDGVAVLDERVGQVVRLADVLQLGALGGELRGFVFVAIHGMFSFQVAEK